MKIAFFIGSVDISGGSYVIYQHALFLQQQGHDVFIIAQFPFTSKQLEWHPATHVLRFVHISGLSNEYFDLAIATWWKTAAELHLIKASYYCYFVQSIESRFYPDHQKPLKALVDHTYTLPLPGLTEARWIQKYLKDSYNHDYHLVPNGIRKDLYNTTGKQYSSKLPKGQLRVLVEGPFGVSFKNVGKTIKLTRKAKPDEIWLLTSSDISRYPGVDRVFSRISIDKVGEIYRSCDVIIKLSYIEGMFGPPLEMFHCGGTAIVYAVTGHDEYINANHNAIVIPRDDEIGVIDAIKKLQNDYSFLSYLKENAKTTADQWIDWNESSRIFSENLIEYTSLPPTKNLQETLRQLNEAAWSKYSLEENKRLKSCKKDKIHYKIDALLDKLPYRISKSLRFARYVIEGL